MSREIQKDFNGLCSFIENYNLNDIISNSEAKGYISSCHKKYYAFLVIVEEYRLLIDSDEFVPKLSDISFSYLQESCSDIGQAFFLSIHGCYKGAKLLIRSSIENFLKSICYCDDPSIIETKSVYEVFDKAKLNSVFEGDRKKIHLDLHDFYAKLCMDVHTADKDHMESISALNHFPKYDKESCKSIQSIVIKLVVDYITVLALKFNDHYHHIGFANKEILNSVVLKQYKRKIQNLE